MLVRLGSHTTLRMTVDIDDSRLLVEGKSNGTPIAQIERIYSDKKSTKHQTLNTFPFPLYPFPKMFTFVELHFLVLLDDKG